MVALAFSALVTGVALLLLAPAVTIGCAVASFLFVVGVLGNIILVKLNESDTPVPSLAGVVEAGKDVVRRVRGQPAPDEQVIQVKQNGHLANGNGKMNGNTAAPPLVA